MVLDLPCLQWILFSSREARPANFLDVGGGATEAQVQKGFEILNNDPNVKAILVNIFGGIMKCDVIANGIINAAKEIGIRKPIVIRLQGTNVEKGKLLIEECGFKMILADDLEDAATKAVGVADIAAQAEQIGVEVIFGGSSTKMKNDGPKSGGDVNKLHAT